MRWRSGQVDQDDALIADLEYRLCEGAKPLEVTTGPINRPDPPIRPLDKNASTILQRARYR